MWKETNKEIKGSFILALISLILCIALIIFEIDERYYQYIPGDIILPIIVYSEIIAFIIALISIRGIIRRKEKGIIFIVFVILLGIIYIILSIKIVSDSSRKGRNDMLAHIISNVKQVQTALELYHEDNGFYPVDIKIGDKIEYNGITYMATVPSSKRYNSKDSDICPKDFEYQYIQINNGQSFKLIYCLWDKVGNLEKGFHTATPESVDSR